QTGLNPQGNFASQLNGIIFGGLLIVTMMLAPRGVAGAYYALRHRRAATGGDVMSPTKETYAEAQAVPEQFQ
ncbi:MAG: hypothetical protein B7Z73_07165, partial [Planctomycetia bacterium 21-64-5]